MTAQTPIYGIKYLVQGEPVRNTRQALEDNAKTIEAALSLLGVAPPAAATFLALVARVSQLEAETPALPRLEVVMTGNNVFGGNYKVPWNAVTASQTTPALTLAVPNNANYVLDTANRAVQVKKAGLYHIDTEIRTNSADPTQFLAVGVAATATAAFAQLLGQIGYTSSYGLLHLSTLTRLAANDWVSVMLNTPGSALADTTSQRSRWSMTRLSA